MNKSFDYKLYKQAKNVPIVICCLNIHEHQRTTTKANNEYTHTHTTSMHEN